MVRSLVLGLVAGIMLFSVVGCGSSQAASPEETKHFDDNRKREQAEDAAHAGQ